MTAAPATLERMWGLRDLHEAGYGDRRTISKLIYAGDVPAVKIGNAFKIRESDLHLIGDPLGETRVEKPKVAEDTLGNYVTALVNTFPKLNAEQKTELGRLLGAAA